MSEASLSESISTVRQQAATVPDPSVRELLRELDQAQSIVGGDQLAVGDIAGSTGVAIGRQIEMTINQANLPPALVSSLTEVLQAIRNQMQATVSIYNRYRFLDIIEDKTRDFVGREYVFGAIDSFQVQHPSGYFTIVGNPGMGKSAIIAQFVKQSGSVAHFNVRSQGITSPQDFLASLSAQISDRFRLGSREVPAEPTQYGPFLSQLLAEASTHLTDGKRLVIAVDALDEADTQGQLPGSNVLYLPPVLPNGVYFVMSRRAVSLPFVVQAAQETYDLAAHADESSRDVQTYIKNAAQRPGLESWMSKQGISSDELVATLAARSENNFMYLRYILPAIESGFYQDLSVQSLPSGLEGYYEDHWARMGMAASPLPRIKLKIVYILAEVKEAVSLKMLVDFADEDALTVQEVLDEWDQFLNRQTVDGSPRYSVYHASFRDFLHRKDIVQAAGITIKEIHGAIAGNLFDDLFG